ncbi:hypothetical protein [Methylobacterium longum]|uniref:Uncharacterized protein n=1 Tax=Methylobacterium longum TaxID=767694 RepID=A0ABT8AVR0_9HYPH|nr:hypothetical protein [Methylobacterium longum]MDN3573358.1 hypothetical protein [Methylobacterium longum]GJE13930.1 hypothetical protein FOHLNKBM_4999 [Methylobacterium longum]
MPQGNRFEQVDEAPDDAMTLILSRDGDRLAGKFLCPASVTGGRLPKDFRGAEMPLKEAFRAAVKFANDFKVPMVVIDPDGLWQPEWGLLERQGDSAE